MKILKLIAGGGRNTVAELAEGIRRMGRGKDTVLAHITPEEARMLKKMGGRGTRNPKTGLPEFQMDEYSSASYGDIGDPYAYEAYDMDIPGAGGTVAEQQADISAGFYEPQFYGMQPSSYDFDVPGAGGSLAEQRFAQAPASARGYAPAELQDFADFDIPGARGTVEEQQRDIEAGLYKPESSGLLQGAEKQLQSLRDLANRNPNLARALGLGGTIALTGFQASRARRQARELANQLRSQAAPFRAGQAEAMSRATGGGLTPQQARALQIAQARAREALGSRGAGTGSAAAGVLAGQEQRARSTARQQSFEEALQLAQVADKYDQAALRAQLEADDEIASLVANVLGSELRSARQTQASGTPQQTRRT